MAKKKTKAEQKPVFNNLKDADSKLYNIIDDHYQMWTEDNEKRMHRDNGWNDITDAYYGKLGDDWPYNSRVVDPRLSTTLIEKNSRLLNSKLRGRLVPREGGDAIKARINNAILDYQWDNAGHGGSMLGKWAMMDMDSRLYGSKFALVCWKVIKDNEGKIIFEGNEFEPKDIRDCGIDPNCQNIKDANWFQLREWTTIEELEKCNKNKEGIEVFPGLKKLKAKIEKGEEYSSDRRDNAYVSRLKQLKGIEDRMGDDEAYPVIEIVTEYRTDRWVTFAPRHRVILRDIKNPYEHKKIPIVQLKYYPLGDDPIGESEVERVLPLWRAIQCVVNAHLDGMNVRMFPPLKIIEGQARIESIVYGPGAPWIMNRADAVTEMNFGNGSLNEFQTNYSALVSAFNQAMGDLSQGVSNISPMEQDKTATEIRHVARQQNIRDEKNQTDLAGAISDCMSMWLSNNKQFLFSDPEKHEHVLRILGKDEFQYFKDIGMDEMELDPIALQEIQAIIEERQEMGQPMTDAELTKLMENAKTPVNPVVTNPNVKNPAKYKVKPKMTVSEKGDYAELSVVPEDVDGLYDYVPDVKSMSIGSDVEYTQGLRQLFEIMINPQITQMLSQEGVKVNIQDLLINLFNQFGSNDAEQYFQTIEQPALGAEGSVNGMPGQGGPGLPNPNVQGGGQPMAQPQGLPGQPGLSGGVQPPMGEGPSL
jgi:hypothetical protein